MSLDFSEFIDVFDEDEFEEIPVPLETFLYDKKYLALDVRLSPIQFEIVSRGSQIYKEHTLKRLHGEEKGYRLWKENCKELIFCLGKGSGKDFMSQIICAYIVYQLLCLRDPAKYYNKPAGDNIDIVNVAINAQQAASVFFAGFKTRIKLCPWFNGKYNDRARDIEFIKGIRVWSLNSQGEGTEGLNILAAVLDEIDGFDEGKTTENAQKMFDTLSATVSSRFSDVGKILELSFTRSTDGFMLKRYNYVIAEKETIIRKHTFKLNSDLPDGKLENEFSIQWEEDHVISYKFDKIMTFRRPTWEVHPDKTIDDFTMDFYSNPMVALGKFACCPSDYTDNTWFRDKDRIDSCFDGPNGLSDYEGDVDITLTPDPSKQYYIHVDLARVQDNCAISMAHVESFKKASFDASGETSPFIIIDLVRYWKPDRSRPIDFSDVRNFIIALKRKGFNIIQVTFDRWNADQIRDDLEKIGIKTDRLSVGTDHYSELALSMGQNMIKGPAVVPLIKELKKLIVDDKGRVDHTNKSSKDLSDAVCGAAYGAAKLTPKTGRLIEVQTIEDVIRANREEARKKPTNNAMHVPRGDMPDSLKSFLEEIRLL